LSILCKEGDSEERLKPLDTEPDNIGDLQSKIDKINFEKL
jgi:hypothetical protein